MSAFSSGIDAWWEDRQHRDDEIVVLQALLDDLNQKKLLLMDARLSVRARIDSATRLLQAANDEDQDLGEDSLDRLIGDLLWLSVISAWDSAPMDAVIFGGEIVQISNVALVERLSQLQISLDRMTTYAIGTQTFHYNELMPFLSNHANLAQIGNSIENSPGDLGSDIVMLPEIKISNPRNHAELLSMTQFQGLLFYED